MNQATVQGRRKVIDIGGEGSSAGGLGVLLAPQRVQGAKPREVGHFSTLKTNFSWYLTV